MMASLRAKTGGGKRSGNGRECKLLTRQSSLVQDNSENRTKVPARAGHGAQAAAWNSSLNFVKSPKTTNSSSNSTSPETDPGTSDLFPFFKDAEERGADGELSLMSEDEREARGSASTSSSASAAAAAVASTGRKASERKAASIDLDCRNPMFHAANANAEKAVASLFPSERCEESTRAAMNGSNPMFRRSISSDGADKPRPKAKAEALRRAASAKAKAAGGGTNEDSVMQLHRPNLDGKGDGKGDLPKKKKKEKAMYEHVGRMNVRPFQEDEAEDPGQHQHGFRIDTFARNEGEAGGKAHFKFVFTVDEDPLEPPSGDKKSRPVLDAIHERTTGNLRMRVNDGRELGATRSAAVEIAIANIGVVLFNPKTMAKGHHLYTLSLHGRTLFSVLA